MVREELLKEGRFIWKPKTEVPNSILSSTSSTRLQQPPQDSHTIFAPSMVLQDPASAMATCLTFQCYPINPSQTPSALKLLPQDPAQFHSLRGILEIPLLPSPPKFSTLAQNSGFPSTKY